MVEEHSRIDMNLLNELKKQLETKDNFLEHGPSSDIGQEWLSRTKELLAKVDHGMAQEFDDLGRKSALGLSSFTLRPMLARMIMILRNAINYIELAETEKLARPSIGKISEISETNFHREYWSRAFYDFGSFLSKYKKLLLTAIAILVLGVLVYFGRAKYIPEFSFPFGTFKIGEDNTHAGEETDQDSKKLDRSIFDLAKETITGGLTSQGRVNLIRDISGLETRLELGKVEDIGTDGLTFLIWGNSGDNFTGVVQCDFSSDWKQRLSLLRKGSEIKFIGTVSQYDLSMQWIVLSRCKLTE